MCRPSLSVAGWRAILGTDWCCEPFISGWTFGRFPPFGCYEKCCYGRSCSNACFHFSWADSQGQSCCVMLRILEKALPVTSPRRPARTLRSRDPRACPPAPHGFRSGLVSCPPPAGQQLGPSAACAPIRPCPHSCSREAAQSALRVTGRHSERLGQHQPTSHLERMSSDSSPQWSEKSCLSVTSSFRPKCPSLRVLWTIWHRGVT